MSAHALRPKARVYCRSQWRRYVTCIFSAHFIYADRRSTFLPAELWIMYYVAMRGGAIMRSSGGARRRYNAIKRRYTAASLWCSHGAITVSVYIINYKMSGRAYAQCRCDPQCWGSGGIQASGAHHRWPAERAPPCPDESI